MCQHENLHKPREILTNREKYWNAWTKDLHHTCDGDFGKVLLLLRHDLGSPLQLEQPLEGGGRLQTPGRSSSSFVEQSKTMSTQPGRCPWTEPGESHRSHSILLKVLNGNLSMECYYRGYLSHVSTSTQHCCSTTISVRQAATPQYRDNTRTLTLIRAPIATNALLVHPC